MAKKMVRERPCPQCDGKRHDKSAPLRRDNSNPCIVCEGRGHMNTREEIDVMNPRRDDSRRYQRGE